MEWPHIYFKESSFTPSNGTLSVEMIFMNYIRMLKVVMRLEEETKRFVQLPSWFIADSTPQKQSSQKRTTILQQLN